MNVLLVYPKIPDTYWSFKFALPFEGKRSAFPPLGLLTISSFLPKSWNKKLVDMNIRKLKNKDLKWADMVLLSAMIIQKGSFHEVVGRCREYNVTVVAGGPYITTGYKKIPGVDYAILGEGENTFPQFLKDFGRGQAEKVYASENKPDASTIPIPDFELLKPDLNRYDSMAVQYSRGCPYNCEFCDIIELWGRVPRVKSNAQILTELDILYKMGWRRSIFVVDDNFIGNKQVVKKMLPDLRDWMQRRGYPFRLYTEATVNLAKDDLLLKLMVEAGFHKVFLGIETPVEKNLLEAHKAPNTGKDLAEDVRKIQTSGMQVMGGFIVGFDNDPEDIFDRIINFIRETHIPFSMVGILTALPNTQLFRRLKREGRLTAPSTGDNVQCSINFRPKMDVRKLLEGYQRILRTIYHPREYYERALGLFERYRPARRRTKNLKFSEIKAFVRSVLKQGVFERHRFQYWKFLMKTLIYHRRNFGEAVTLAIVGRHFHKFTKLLCKQANAPILKT